MNKERAVTLALYAMMIFCLCLPGIVIATNWQEFIKLFTPQRAEEKLPAAPQPSTHPHYPYYRI